MDIHDERRDKMFARMRRPKHPLNTISSARNAWNIYRTFKANASSAYHDYMRHNNLTHHARFEAYEMAAEEWENALEEWFGHEELASKDWDPAYGVSRTRQQNPVK